jgi:D-beta-D-heptose 7-phosphate kinase / D-beta-D-heptose 1-phosphate adenosyltransferase
VLMGLLGRDQAGEEVRALIGGAQGIVDAHMPSADRPTVCKTRFIAGHQQMVRVDEESPHDLEAEEERALLTALDRHLPQCDAIILSDYAKGTLGPKLIETAIARARARDIPVFVDPKNTDFARYRGATCIAPNLRELAAASQLPVATDADVIAATAQVMRDVAADAILVTRSEKGMALVEASGAVHIEAARAREVFDVSGAGDTVMAVLALACVSGYSLPQAMHLANTAAGIAVSKLGTATVELDELMLELSRDVRDKDWLRAKYYSADEAETLVRRWKSRGLSVGFTNGCFDVLHAGHVALLAAARAECDRLVVALNTDHGVRRLKGPERPVNGLEDRSAVIAAVESVDAVISFDEETPIELIRRLKPDVLVKGGDYTIEGVVGHEDVQANGGRVLLVDLVEGRSTTRLIEAIRGKPTAASGSAPRAARPARARSKEDAA